MTRRSFDLIYADVPPSLNAIGYRSHWATGQRHKKRWQGNLESLILAARIPRAATKVTAEAVLSFDRVRRRDEGNFRVLVEKALGDALVSTGVLADDTPNRYSFGSLSFVVAPAKQTKVALTVTYDNDRKVRNEVSDPDGRGASRPEASS